MRNDDLRGMTLTEDAHSFSLCIASSNQKEIFKKSYIMYRQLCN